LGIVVVDADNNPQTLPGFLEKGYSSFDVWGSPVTWSFFWRFGRRDVQMSRGVCRGARDAFNFPSIQRRDACESLAKAGERAVEGAPLLDIRHVECLGALHGEHVAGVIEVFGAAPAELMDDDVLRGE
jgi:hypothetical protein